MIRDDLQEKITTELVYLDSHAIINLIKAHEIAFSGDLAVLKTGNIFLTDKMFKASRYKYIAIGNTQKYYIYDYAKLKSFFDSYKKTHAPTKTKSAGWICSVNDTKLRKLELYRHE